MGSIHGEIHDDDDGTHEPPIQPKKTPSHGGVKIMTQNGPNYPHDKDRHNGLMTPASMTPLQPRRLEKDILEIDGIRVERSPAHQSLTGTYFGTSSPVHGSFSPKMTSSNVHQETRNVQAYGSNHPMNTSMRPHTIVTGTNPALVALQASAKIPYFDGNDRHWMEFTRDWSRYSAYTLLNAPEGQIGDTIKRDLLVNCLHGLLRKKYDSAIIARPERTFTEIWRDLERLYSVDDPQRWISEWQQVALDCPNNGRIMLKDFLLFQSAFETAKLMVTDWTNQEELDLILRQLPNEWRKKSPQGRSQ
jgi:hypothetical protein